MRAAALTLVFVGFAFVLCQSKVISVGCLGDSITQGGCGDSPSSLYPYLLQQLLSSRSYNVTNYGVSGTTMLTDGLCGSVQPSPPPNTNCSYVGTSSYAQVLHDSPRLASIMFGTNDAKYYNYFGVRTQRAESFFLDYLSMIRSLQRVGVEHIFVMTPPVLYRDGQYGMNATVINHFYPTLLTQLVGGVNDHNNVHLVDVNGAFVQHCNASCTCDGVHPLKQGNVLIANALFKAITALKLQ